MVLKQRIYFLLDGSMNLPGYTILGKDASG